jgi:ketol-acid reductoisomerase
VNDPLEGARVAVLGYGNQGVAHAHNLRAAGMTIVVGARPGRPGEARARADGFETLPPAEAVRGARVVALLVPDEALPAMWPELRPALPDDAGVVLAHGFNLLYSDLQFPSGADVVLVSPTGPGVVLARVRERGERLPAYIAVHRDGTGRAWEVAESYGARLGCSPLVRTTVREETEVDLFGEQVVLCGGMNALTRSAFETLVEAGYSPEVAYLECVHQLRYLAELLHERGPAGFRRGISATARYGDVTRGDRVVGEPSREAMHAILAEIQSGAFAREWRAEVDAGTPRLRQAVETAEHHPMETARKRALGSTGDPGPPAQSPNALSKK